MKAFIKVKTIKTKTASAAALLAAFLLSASMIAAGCGGGNGGQPAQEVPREPGADLTSERFMPGTGTVFDYYRNVPGPDELEGVPVNFSLEADWDFSGGKEGERQSITVVDPASAPGAERFPEATLCLRSEVSGETAHLFYSQDQAARKLLGMYIISSQGRDSWSTYNPAMTVLVFPLSPGTQMSEELEYSDSEGQSYRLFHRLSVVWIGSMRVPAGEFPETAMIQHYEVSGSGPSSSATVYYSWYAPDVGQLANVASLPNETQAAFNRAAELRRLYSFRP